MAIQQINHKDIGFMNSSMRIFYKFFFILLLSIPFTSAMANTGKAFNIVGTVALNDVPMVFGDVIKEGDVIKTGKDSSVNITMADRSVINITENAEFKFTKYSYSKENAPGNKSVFNLLKGSMRYISGLIAKANPNDVQIQAGTATIGIRGTLVRINNNNEQLTVDTSLGTAQITLPDGSTLDVSRGNTGKLTFSTGTSSVTPTTTPDPIMTAAQGLSSDPIDMSNFDTLTDAEKALTLAAVMRNAVNLGLTQDQLDNIIRSIVTANPHLAATIALVASSLDPDRANIYVDIIQQATPGTGDDSAIEDASGAGGGLGIGEDVTI